MSKIQMVKCDRCGDTCTPERAIGSAWVQKGETDVCAVCKNYHWTEPLDIDCRESRLYASIEGEIREWIWKNGVEKFMITCREVTE